jgi:putative tricarboxylic transport membrane protein
MIIRNPKDFWAGLMFVTIGLAFVLIAAGSPGVLDKLFGAKLIPGYQMGGAVRMGPAYFPVVLGGLLAVLGAIVLLRSFASHLTGDAVRVQLPFNIVDLAVGIGVFAVLLTYSGHLMLSADNAMLVAALVVSVLSIKFRPDAKPLVLLLAGCLAFAYTLKPLGLIGATLLLVFISAFGGHEFKWKEVAILYVVLIIFSVLVFVKGLTLPFAICPALIEDYCRF